MRVSVVAAALCVPSALAFPWSTPEGMDALLRHPEARREIERRLEELRTGKVEKRQLGGIVGSLGSLLGGTLGAVLDNVLGLIPTAAAVKGLQRFPEGKLETICRNIIIDIPRNGIANIGQINAATAKVFNMGVDVSSLLAGFGAAFGGDILTTTMSIGGRDDRVGLLGGVLNEIFGTPSGIAGHGKLEGDSSPTRYDFYLQGDNLSFQPELFKQLHQQALAKGNGTYNVDAVKEHFKNRYAASRAANSRFYFNAPSGLVVMGGYYFIPGFFSNGTIGQGGIANEASITSFYGAKPDRENAWQDPDLTYTRVPERIPEVGWYRRATPMTVAEAVGGILDVYLYANPQLGGAGADQAWVVGPLVLPNNPQALSCFLYNAIFANFPSELFNSVTLLQSILNPLVALLAPGFQALGCQIDLPDATGTQNAQLEQQFIGPAKTKAVGSPWYTGS
ncbi:hypothetical protein LQW54_011176 [Pestalotiopsis sp. IQ-011]